MRDGTKPRQHHLRCPRAGGFVTVSSLIPSAVRVYDEKHCGHPVAFAPDRGSQAGLPTLQVQANGEARSVAQNVIGLSNSVGA